MLNDIRHGLRSLAASPAFAATAAAVLAVAIGLNAAVFTVFDVLLLKPIGGTAPGRLAVLRCVDRKTTNAYEPLSYGDYRLLAESPIAFSSLLAYRLDSAGITENGATRRTFIAAVSSNYFTILGTRPLRGRGFLRSEEGSPTATVAVVSHSYWRRQRFDDAILGRALRVNGRDFTIVGVMPEGFSGTTALFSPEVWVPLGALHPPAAIGAAPSAVPFQELQVAGRLEPSLTIVQARALVAPLGRRLEATRPGKAGTLVMTAESLSRLSPGSGAQADRETAGVMLFLLGMTAIVLLIATLDLANMLLARGHARRRDIGIRLALGARPAQVLRQLITESLLLSGIGAMLGLGLATVALRLIAGRLDPVLPFALAFEVWPSYRVVVATAGYALLCACIFGVGPAISQVRQDRPYLSLTAADPRAGRCRIRNALVAAQLAMSLALLVAAGLFVQGAWRATAANPGFALDNGVVAALDPSLAGGDEPHTRETYRRVLDRVRGMPGVESASLASLVPFSGASEMRSLRRAGDGTAGGVRWAVFTVVGADYFRTVRLPVLRGREFDRPEEQAGGARRVAIVDETLARDLWANGNALGQTIQLSDDDTTWEGPVEIVGIVPAVRDGLFDRRPAPHVYVPTGGTYRAGMTVHARTRATSPGGDLALVEPLRRTLRAVDPRLPVMSVRTLAQHRDASLYMWVAVATARLFSAFALAALALAMLGVYGVKAYLVARRTREIGIRMSLGARRSDILALVIGDSLRLTCAGVAAGLGAGILLSRVLAAWVYGMGEGDWAMALAAAALLSASTVAASWVPARRAIAVAPLEALRHE